MVIARVPTRRPGVFLCFEARDAVGERGDGGGAGMSDGDGEAVAAGVAGGEFELSEDGFARGDVVQKNFARSGAHAVALGGVVGHGPGVGAAVYEEEATLAERRHQSLH